MLGGFHVRFLSEQHDTLHHPSGEFFWKFLLVMCLLFYFLKPFGRGFGNYDPEVFGLNSQYPFCLLNPFDCTLNAKRSICSSLWAFF